MKLTNKKAVIFIAVGLICAILLIFIGSKGDSNAEENSSLSLADYESQIEERLALLIGELKGIGKVKVMVTAASDYEKVYAKNTQEEENTVKSEYYNSGERKPLQLTELSPRINGVAVVCQGGDDMLLKQKITELISDVLGISTSKIFVGS